MSWNDVSAPNFRFISPIFTVFVATVQSRFRLGTAFSTDHVTLPLTFRVPLATHHVTLPFMFRVPLVTHHVTL